MTLAFAVTAIACVAGARSDDDLERRLAAEARRGDGTLVRIASLTDFSWDELHIFPPYTSQETVDRQLGFAWPDGARSGVSSSDGIALLVFVASGKVVRYVAHPRNDGDFTSITASRGLVPAEAVFVVRADSDGRMVFKRP